MCAEVFAINRANVVDEVIEGEAIIINMETGRYYSLEGSGGLIWELLQNGPCSVPALVEVLQPAYQASSAQIETAVQTLLIEMKDEGLLIPAEEEVKLTPVSTKDRMPFPAPVLSKYTDLEALLLIDPIHDVSSDGWPHTKSSNE